MTRKLRSDDQLDRTGSSRPAETRDDGIRVRRLKNDPGVTEARRRFGGLDWLATFAGLLAGVGALVLLGGLVGAVGTIGYQLDQVNATGEDLSLGGLVAGLVVLLLAFFIGGWVAGRVARYDGGRNGVMTVIWFLLLGGLLSALGGFYGDRYDVFTRFELPQWFSPDDAGTAAVISAIVGALVALVAGWLGGVVGARYHRRADALVTHTRDEAIVQHEVVDRPVAEPREGRRIGTRGGSTAVRRGR